MCEQCVKQIKSETITSYYFINKIKWSDFNENQAAPVINASNYDSSLSQPPAKKGTPCLVTENSEQCGQQMKSPQRINVMCSCKNINTHPIIQAPPVTKATTGQGLLLSLGIYKSNLYNAIVIKLKKP